MTSNNSEPMPPEARKLARLAIASAITFKLLEQVKLAWMNDPEVLDVGDGEIVDRAYRFADKLLEKSGL